MGLLGLVARGAALPLRAVVAGARRWMVRRGVILELDVDEAADPVVASWLPLALREAAHDPRVASVWLRLRAAPAGWALTEDLRACIRYLEAHRTPVVALFEEADTRLYWLASAASQVVMVPPGTLHLRPLGGELYFYGGALERVGVEVEVVAAGTFKAAGEPFSRRSASPAHLQASEALVAALQGRVVADIAASRGRTQDEVLTWLRAGPCSARAAQEAGLVDEVRYEDEVADALDAAARRLDGWRWLRWAGYARTLAGWGRGRRLAVLHLHGTVVMKDEAGRGAIAARDVVPLVDALREDDGVVAVVLAVDSPGGSALASDLIWRAVARLADAKPVVAAFGDVSASGGYYLAAACRRIVARSTTLTGSIGVVGGKPVLEGLLRRLGVTSQPIGAGAGPLSPVRPMSPDDRAQLEALMAELYLGFVQRVADGRGRPVAEVEPHCRGRVWSGMEAHEVGLVDDLGGLSEAIEVAAKDAGGELRVEHLQVDTQGWVQRLVRDLLRRQIGASVPAAWRLGEERAWTWWPGGPDPR